MEYMDKEVKESYKTSPVYMPEHLLDRLVNETGASMSDVIAFAASHAEKVFVGNVLYLFQNGEYKKDKKCRT